MTIMGSCSLEWVGGWVVGRGGRGGLNEVLDAMGEWVNG